MRRALLGLLVAVVLLGGCTDDDSPEPAADGPPADADASSQTGIVAPAVRRTLDEGSARTAFETEIQGLAGTDGPIAAAGEGLIDFENRTSTLTIDLASVLEGLGLPGLEGEVESRSVGDERWLRSPFFNSVLGVPTEWLLLDVGAADGEADGLTQLGALTGNDPADQLRLLAGVDPDSVDEVGREDVRGEGTTHYRATLDPEAAVAAAPEADRARLEALAAQLGSGPVAVDVWIDGDGRVRRMATDVPLPPAAGGGTAQVGMDLFDFGVDVEVEPPPPDDVTPASELTNPGP
jgi:hypothetical protein